MDCNEHIIHIKALIEEDYVNYKKPCMFIGTPTCSFKCDYINGGQKCQNGTLALAPTITLDIDELIQRYLDNPLTKAVVIGGLEPFDSFPETIDFIKRFRLKCSDDIVIYTGYYPFEVSSKLKMLNDIDGNIIVKFGRYLADSSPCFDKVLGVNLASDNQYALPIRIPASLY